ncbi:MAG TPA: glutathione peroxidase [Prevotella sp.]
MATIYNYTALTGKGQELNLSQFEGKVLLIVNTASKCGFTPQFEGLEALNQKYKDCGLVVLGFPCNQFANQDPGTDSEIAEFCSLNFGVTFQIMKKVDVNGKNASPVFQFLKKHSKGTFGSAVKWNFTKFLVAKDGQTVKRFAPTTVPAKLEKEIELLLEQ